MSNNLLYRDTLVTLVDRLCRRFKDIKRDEILEAYQDSITELGLDESNHSSMIENMGTEVQFIESYLKEKEIEVEDDWTRDYVKYQNITLLIMLLGVLFFIITFFVPELWMLAILGMILVIGPIRPLIFFRTKVVNKTIYEYSKPIWTVMGIAFILFLIYVAVWVIRVIVS